MNWDRESIRSLRKTLGVTQNELAELLGCRQQTISEWEVGLYLPANAYGKLLDQLAATGKSSTVKWERPDTKLFESLIQSKPHEEAYDPAYEKPFDPCVD